MLAGKYGDVDGFTEPSTGTESLGVEGIMHSISNGDCISKQKGRDTYFAPSSQVRY